MIRRPLTPAVHLQPAALLTLAFLAAGALGSPQAAADPIAEFYKGKSPVFAVGTGARPLAASEAPFGPIARAAALDRLCAAAAEVFARAIVHGLLSATSLAGLVAYREVWPADQR